jgi:aspartyl-tRNA(Asn)/glutamyl-tRNA(Gln) amidotransferase subunit C
MSISDLEVKKIAKLSRLRIPEDKIAYIQKELSDIQKVIGKVQEVNCEDVEPLCSVHDSNLRLREDEVKPDTTPEDLLSNFPGKDSALAKQLNCFIVPKVVE